MRRGMLVAAVLGTAGMGLAGHASAANGVPPGLQAKVPEVFTCDGQETVVFGGNGRSGWVGDTLYVARSIHFEGTFTPADGSPSQTFVFDKTFGRGPAGETVNCVSHVEETDETSGARGRPDSAEHVVAAP